MPEKTDRVLLQAVSSDGQAITLEASSTFSECVAMAARSLWVNRSLSDYMADQVKGLKADADAQTDESAKWQLMDSMRQATMTLAEMKQREDFLDRRLNHAIKCLKRKNLYANDLEELSRICVEKNLAKTRGLIQIVRCCMGEDFARIGTKSDLDEVSWRIGIELAMAQHEPELFASDNLFGPRIEDNYQYIAVNAMMAAHGAKLSQLFESEDYMDEMHSLIMDHYLNHPKIAGSIVEWARKLVQNDIEEDLKKLAQTEKALGEERETTEKLREQLKAAEKAAAPNQKAAQRLNDRIAALEQELKTAGETIETYRNALDQRDRVISKLSVESDTEDEHLLPLPEKNVVFVGGHINLARKLKEAHPGWVFVDGTVKAFNEFSPPEIIFLWTKHMAHPVSEKALRMIGPDTIRVYLESTNPELLEREMSRGYTAAKQDTGTDIYED